MRDCQLFLHFSLCRRRLFTARRSARNRRNCRQNSANWTIFCGNLWNQRAMEHIYTFILYKLLNNQCKATRLQAHFPAVRPRKLSAKAQCAALRQLPTHFGLVDINFNHLVFGFSHEAQTAVPCLGHAHIACFQRLRFVFHAAERCIEASQALVPCAPRLIAAAERIRAALHPDFVAVVDAGHAREHELQKRRSVQPPHSKCACFR